MSHAMFSTTYQKKILRGLRKRFGALSERSQRSQGELEAQLAALENDFSLAKQRLEEQQRDLRSSAVTRWDEELDREWGKMEQVSLNSLRRQEKQLEELTTKLRQQKDDANKKFLADQKKLQQEFDSIKHHPAKLLEKKKQELSALLQRSKSEFESCQQLIAARSMRIPENKSEAASNLNLGSLEEANQTLLAQEQAIQNCLSAMKRSPSALWADGIRVWLLGAGFSLITGAILWYLQYNLLVFIIGGLGAGILVSIALLFGLRPAMKRMTLREFPKAEEAWKVAQMAAKTAYKFHEEDCVQEQTRMKNDFRAKMDSLEKQFEELKEKLQKQLNDSAIRIRETERSIRSEAASLHTANSNKSNQVHRPIVETLLKEQSSERHRKETESAARIAQLRQEVHGKLEELRQRLYRASTFASQSFEALRAANQEWFPTWQNMSVEEANRLPRNNLLAILPVGQLSTQLMLSDASKAPKEVAETLPFYFRIVEDGTMVLEAEGAARKSAQECVRNLLIRALTSLPAGGFQTTVIDPDGLGKDYSWLMHLADVDPRIVNYRVWTQSNHIAEQLGRLAHHTEDVIQQLLRDRYRDIRAYNREAGTMAEPYRLIVWSRFPAGLDENSWRSLCALMSSGGRCGVGVLLLWDTSIPWPPVGDKQRLIEAGLRVRIEASDLDSPPKVWVLDKDLESAQLALQAPPSEEIQSHLLDRCASEAVAGSRIEVPFDSLMPAEQAAYQASSAEGLVIPLGQAGVGRNQTLRLGTGTSQHVLIAGKTGSGKSSLLHTMITSAAIKYGPDQLRLILLDFKKGVEFQVYAESKIPHTDIIGIESQREFGLSTLEYLDRVMQKRGEMFRNAGVQDVASWVRRNPDRPMPRILVVVDEFQELFVEDDKLAQQASMFLDRIVRQGRSFGMHVVLASQTLGGAYSLPRTTLAQMAVRIALQCEGSDAMIILSEDNLAAERLRHAGQAVYNDASGRVEGNQPFQVAYISKEVQQGRLEHLPAADTFIDESNNGLGRCIIFEGHKAAAWDQEAMERSLNLLPAREANAIGAILGDSVSIEPAVAIQWNRQSGRNLILVGPEDRNAADCLQTLIGTSYRSALRKLNAKPSLYYLDGSRPDDEHVAKLSGWIKQLDPASNIADVRTVEPTIRQVYEELKLRTSAHDVNHPPLFLIITQLGRFRDLRKVEDFSFGSDESSAKPDAQFIEILRDGPSVGIHSILWVDNWNTLSRWLPRQALHDLELRVLMQMSANDSNHLIDSAAANRLDSHVLMVHDEATGIGRKFRPYRVDNQEAFLDWIR